jgi:spermidine synthase
MWKGLMKVVRRYQGRLGEIVIWENQANGSRFYYEGNIFQSHSCSAGDSQFTYVKMMAEFLNKASKVLVLGCGGGNLATMLTRSGQSVTVVDHNATSFAIAREYFGMPADIPCFTEDFRRYLLAETTQFDGIAIDVGGPGFCFEEQFDPATCRSIKKRLAPGGRIIMNMLVAHDLDGAADTIGAQFSDDCLRTWILDEPGFPHRNALIVSLPKQDPGSSRLSISEFCKTEEINWTPRRPRYRAAGRRPISIEITCSG